ncbi:MAG: tRNA dimethylallyltransferase [Selenomonadaceae bacterium]|nr:tRNA dimethylallyltransferase [Selenomonadaceae bacterium]
MRNQIKEIPAEIFDFEKILSLMKNLQEENSPREKVFVILGATSAGKSSLAIKLAEIFQTEIISADSMAIYKNFDIGTAKPTADELKKIPHHLINILDAEEKFSVMEFVRRAKKIIAEINSRGKIPIIAGGTGLYIQALLEGYKFSDDKSKSRESFFAETGELVYNARVVGLTMNRADLYKKIDERTKKMFSAGLVEEVQKLLSAGVKKNSQAMAGIGYKEVIEFLQGNLTLEETISKVSQATRNFAKRQLTWYRRMNYIKFFKLC